MAHSKTKNINNKSNIPLVTVQCLAYNHEKYIRDCLEGFVIQETNFPFEVIVHDDCSTDNTAAIIRTYAERKPNIIKPIFEKENQYSKKDGSLGRIMDKAKRGKYIALCEGDDYWSDPHKLQKQFDFMESHPDFSMCFHNATCIYNNGKELPLSNEKTAREIPTREAMIKQASLCATNSMFYRKDTYDKYPSILRHSPVGDLPLTIWLAYSGRIYYMPEIMSAYRVMAEGSWSRRQNELTAQEQKSSALAFIKMYENLDIVTKHQYSDIFADSKNFHRYRFYKADNDSINCEKAFKKIKNKHQWFTYEQIIEFKLGKFAAKIIKSLKPLYLKINK